MLDLKVFKQIVGILEMSNKDDVRDSAIIQAYNQYTSFNKEQRDAWEKEAFRKVKPVVLQIKKVMP